MTENINKQKQQDEPQIELGPLGKDKGKISKSLRDGNMVAVLAGMEIMYVLLFRGQFHCFIHPLDSEEGRRKAWDDNERNTAMLDNLYSAADALFEIRFPSELDLMGVMVTAERGIVGYLNMTGNLPARDYDFMDWLEHENNKQEE
ncbi:MAG: hypothetical protein J5569_02900 [Oscillospiraceae bacterium]|nr:hypothetical protein [Oscillospiraceae bacterium]